MDEWSGGAVVGSRRKHHIRNEGLPGLAFGIYYLGFPAKQADDVPLRERTADRSGLRSLPCNSSGRVGSPLPTLIPCRVRINASLEIADMHQGLSLCSGSVFIKKIKNWHASCYKSPDTMFG